MLSLPIIGTGLLALASFTSALVPRQSNVHGPNNRQYWSEGFDIHTEFAEKFPDTGRVVKYFLEATHETMSPDGVPRDMMVFNKQYPGPTIEANWGDIIQITVKNSLVTNGTSIHWHGLRQLHSVQQDGVNGITECPIAPGQSKTYTFKAVEYGSSWYHSHYTIQPGEGLVGNIKINGPSSANYDVEAGFVTLTDWWQTPLFTVFARVLRGPPLADSILVNGLGVVNGSGSYSTIELQPNKKNKLSFVNTGNNIWFHVSIDQHPLTVIAVDFVPVEPFVVTSLSISAGQRYDVIVDANQQGGSFWLRTANGGGQCDGPNRKSQLGDTQGAIVKYAGTSGGQPTTQGYQMPSGCFDEIAGIVPVRKKNVPPPATAPSTLDLTLDTTVGIFWKVNGQAIRIDWSQPTLQYVQNGTYTLPADDNGLTLTGEGWTYWTIQNDTPLPHPIHLHGHNFFIIGAGAGSGQGVSYNLTNPIARDTQTVDAGGYLTIAFPLDNPGVWLLHCHIPFHIAQGLGVQFLENPDKIIPTIGNLDTFNDGCASWRTWEATAVGFDQGDSGLKRRRMIRH